MSELPSIFLRNALRRRAADTAASNSASACVDAESLAAWADGRLSAREREAIVSHAADCARCQAMVAAMARTLPPRAARAWWRMPAVAWLAPAAAVALGAIVWVNVSSPGGISMRQ